MRVLIVEDEPDVSAVFRDFLVELGHEPFLVRSAEAALRSLEQDRPDAIILDIHLPGLSGIEFLQLRPIRDAGLPVIAISGVATERQAREVLRLGAVDFVGKPVALERLGEVLAYIEPEARYQKVKLHGPRVERRRSARTRSSFQVRVLGRDGQDWSGAALDVSPFGLKVSAGGTMEDGALATLGFTLPDGHGSLTVSAVVVRLDRDGYAFHFVDLGGEDFQRLTNFVGRRPRK